MGRISLQKPHQKVKIYFRLWAFKLIFNWFRLTFSNWIDRFVSFEECRPSLFRNCLFLTSQCLSLLKISSVWLKIPTSKRCDNKKMLSQRFLNILLFSIPSSIPSTKLTWMDDLLQREVLACSDLGKVNIWGVVRFHFIGIYWSSDFPHG